MSAPTSTKPANPQLLTIHDRRTLGGPEGVELRRTVDCSRSASSTVVDDCAHCGFGKLVWPEGARRPNIECSHPRHPSQAPRLATIDANTLVKSVMSQNATCARADASLETIAALFLEDGLTAVPVLDADGRPIGLVSKTDLLREVRDRGEIPDASLPRGMHVVPDALVCAGDVMTPLVFAVLENATLGQAIPLMAFEHVHHAPVVTADGRVVGVLSSMDVLRWLSTTLRRA